MFSSFLALESGIIDSLRACQNTAQLINYSVILHNKTSNTIYISLAWKTKSMVADIILLGFLTSKFLSNNVEPAADELSWKEKVIVFFALFVQIIFMNHIMQFVLNFVINALRGQCKIVLSWYQKSFTEVTETTWLFVFTLFTIT